MAETYTSIEKEIKKLQARAEALRKEEVEGVIAKIRIAIDTYGITPDELFPRKKAKKAAAKKAPAKYSDGNGNTWPGRGPRPRWLKDAVAGGKTLEELRV